jgi:hypothetical protein
MYHCGPNVCNELVTSIAVNPFTDDPEKAWGQIESKVSKILIEPLKLDEPIYDDKVIY